MAGDWVSGYMESRQNRERQHEAELRTAELASARAPSFFENLLITVKQDMESFRKHGGSERLKFQPASRRPTGPERTPFTAFCVVHSDAYPFVNLEVKLNTILIEYACSIKADTGHEETKRGTFRIIADLQGRVHTVLAGEPYCDVAEISEFLLRPVFDCL